MPKNQNDAIVLRTFPIGNQDKMVIFFAKSKGLLKGIAKGAKKFGNRFGSALEPMSHVRIFYYEKENKELVTISSCDLLESFFDLQCRIETVYALNYFAELIENSRPSHCDEDLLFRLLLAVLRTFSTGGEPAFLTAYFEVWLLKINGFLPGFHACRKCGSSAPAWLSPSKDGAFCDSCAPRKKKKIPSGLPEFIQWVRKNPPGETFPFSLEQIRSIRPILKEIITYHFEHIPKSSITNVN
jgi:DNA repair protein RecO (recombination protein O)